MRSRTVAVSLISALAVIVTAQAQAPTQETLVQRLQEGTSEERRHAAGALGDIGNDSAVPYLIDALKDDDGVVRELAEHSLWAIWNRSGDSRIDALLQEGIHLMQRERLDEAIAKFDQVVKGAPGFAEGYNRRATAYYLAGQYERSIADCEETITRNPMHFGALSGLGYNYFKLGKTERAIRYFEQALDINPNKPRIQAVLIELRRALQERAKDSI
jgi:tetratricopeptide (TPR) repeat protein